jgi:hypothetical protein
MTRRGADAREDAALQVVRGAHDDVADADVGQRGARQDRRFQVLLAERDDGRLRARRPDGAQRVDVGRVHADGLADGVLDVVDALVVRVDREDVRAGGVQRGGERAAELSEPEDDEQLHRGPR